MSSGLLPRFRNRRALSSPFYNLAHCKQGSASISYRHFASKSARDPLAALISVCMKRGFIFPSADLYQSAAIGYDYGPQGAQLKHNVLSRWWRDFVTHRRDVVALDSCVLSPEAVWAGSGHVKNFADPLTECYSCRKRFRADHLVEAASGDAAAGSDVQLLGAAIQQLDRACPSCGAEGEKGLGGKCASAMHMQSVREQIHMRRSAAVQHAV